VTNQEHKTIRLLICVDFNDPTKPEEWYADFYTELKVIGAQAIHELIWAVRTDTPVNDIFKRLVEHLSPSDRLLVAEIGNFRCVSSITPLKYL